MKARADKSSVLKYVRAWSLSRICSQRRSQRTQRNLPAALVRCAADSSLSQCESAYTGQGITMAYMGFCFRRFFLPLSSAHSAANSSFQVIGYVLGSAPSLST